MNRIFRGLPLLFILMSWSLLAQAEWSLDNAASSLSFVTTKAVDVAEVHHFERLSGEVAEDGQAELVIHLDSVNTDIPIRDERMQELLFETGEWPTATMAVDVPVKRVSELAQGEHKNLTLEGELALRGLTAELSSDVQVAKQADGGLQVSSRHPVLVGAGDLDLLDGVEKLREVADLPSIGNMVAVSFQLTFLPATES